MGVQPDSGVWLTDEQWNVVEQALSKINLIEQAVCKKSLTIDTAEAASILGITEQTVRKYQREGKMPKLVSNKGENFRWNRAAVERIALGKSSGGAPRKNV